MAPYKRHQTVFAIGSAILCVSGIAQIMIDRPILLRALLVCSLLGGLLISHAYQMQLAWGQRLREEREHGTR
jgi:hypothetical protein